MADTSIRYKMNVRSPYYVVAYDDGKPTTTAVDPTPPDEYVEPAVETEAVACGNVINVGEDVGVRHYDLDTKNRTGDITINYSVNVPIRISATWDGNTVNAASGDFVGDGLYEFDMIDAGFTLADLSLGSAGSAATGSLTINKSTESPSNVRVTVTAPLVNDDYQLTFNCPAQPSFTDGTLTPVGNDIIKNVPAFQIFGAYGTEPQISINGVSITNTMLKSQRVYFIVVTDFPELGRFAYSYYFNPSEKKPTLFIDKSTYLNSGSNTIEITLGSETFFGLGDQPHANMNVVRGGIFNDGFQNTWAYAQTGTWKQYGYVESPTARNGIYFYGKTIQGIGTTTYTFTWNEDSGSNYGYFDNEYEFIDVNGNELTGTLE